MATIKIKPIEVQSRGGYPVVITGISPTHHDCISGTIETPGAGTIDGQWDLSGYLRGGTDPCNLDTSLEELADLFQLSRQLGAK